MIKTYEVGGRPIDGHYCAGRFLAMFKSVCGITGGRRKRSKQKALGVLCYGRASGSIVSVMVFQMFRLYRYLV